VRQSVNPSSPVLSPFSSFLSHQRYTVNLSSENLHKEYSTNTNQKGALYVDDLPPQEELEAKKIAEEKRLEEELKRVEERRAEEKKKAEQRKKEDEKKKELRKKHMSVHDIVQIILANNDFKDHIDYEEDEDSNNNNNNNSTNDNSATKNEKFDPTNSIGFESYDEMAIRVTDSLNQKEIFGITRTNSENEITWRRSSTFPAPPLPRSSSFSSLDGILIGKWGT